MRTFYKILNLMQVYRILDFHNQKGKSTQNV
jgi:hypothetical protein